MTELRNVEAELTRFRLRLLALAVVMLALRAAGLAAGAAGAAPRRPGAQAESNRTAVVPIVPNRGRSSTATAWCWPPTTGLHAGDHALRLTDLDETIDASAR
jgi:hypothetical protein